MQDGTGIIVSIGVSTVSVPHGKNVMRAGIGVMARILFATVFGKDCATVRKSKAVRQPDVCFEGLCPISNELQM